MTKFLVTAATAALFAVSAGSVMGGEAGSSSVAKAVSAPMQLTDQQMDKVVAGKSIGEEVLVYEYTGDGTANGRQYKIVDPSSNPNAGSDSYTLIDTCTWKDGCSAYLQ